MNRVYTRRCRCSGRPMLILSLHMSQHHRPCSQRHDNGCKGAWRSRGRLYKPMNISCPFATDNCHIFALTLSWRLAVAKSPLGQRSVTVCHAVQSRLQLAFVRLSNSCYTIAITRAIGRFRYSSRIRKLDRRRLDVSFRSSRLRWKSSEIFLLKFGNGAAFSSDTCRPCTVDRVRK